MPFTVNPYKTPSGRLCPLSRRPLRPLVSKISKSGFLSCHPHSSDEVILKPTGSQLTVEFLEENSFSVPILVLKKDGLGMTLPSPSFTVRDVEHYVGKTPQTFLTVTLSISIKTWVTLGVVTYTTFISSTWKAEAVRFLWIWDQPIVNSRIAKATSRDPISNKTKTKRLQSLSLIHLFIFAF